MEIGFFLKKFITFFIEPFGMILTLFIVGLYFLYMNKYAKAKIFISLTFVVMFIFSYQPFSSFLVKNLENSYLKYNYMHKVKYIHVLGGDDGKRVIEGIIIHNKISGSKLVFTGYAGDNNITSAKKNEDLALALGVKKEDIILGESPRDTKEEAIFMKELLQNEPFILVTSATHMLRSMTLFKSFGLNPIAAPTDFHASEFKGFLIAPGLGELNNSSISMHEYFGILWSKIKNLNKER